MNLGQVIARDTIRIINLETAPAKKFPDLVGTVKQMTLQKEEDTYIATFKYSYAANWVVLTISNDSGDILQHDTYLAQYPINLNQVDELLEYGLFYKDGVIVWVKLADDFYSLKSDYDILAEEYKNAVL